jgi:hypothetical protein
MALESQARKLNDAATAIERRDSNVYAVGDRRGAAAVPQLEEVSAAAAEPPWPKFPRIDFREWRRFERYPNYLAAHIVAGLLENEGVPTIVESQGVFPGADTSAIWVPKDLLHRARWILSLSSPSDAELLFLATGELEPAK